MNWKNCDFRKFLKWCLGFFQEDNEKPSQKRIIAFMIAVILCFHSIKHPDNSELLIQLFGFIAILLGMTYIPTRKKE